MKQITILLLGFLYLYYANCNIAYAQSINKYPSLAGFSFSRNDRFGLADTLTLTKNPIAKYDSCDYIFFLKNKKIISCYVYPIGINKESYWRIDSISGILTIYIIEHGIDDGHESKAEFKIEEYGTNKIVIIKKKDLIARDSWQGEWHARGHH